MIAESSRRRAKVRGFRILIDTTSCRFEYSVRKNLLPFEKIENNTVKIGHIPIKLCWVSHNRAHNWGSKAGGGRRPQFKVDNAGPTRQRPWFRIPLKVKVIPSILGSGPEIGTRIIDLNGSEHEVRGDPESGHSPVSRNPQSGFVQN